MHSDIIEFWFDETGPNQWWGKDPAFDQSIRLRFGHLHNAAIHCALFRWRKQPEGRLAEIIVLDQFSRNMFRDQPQAFTQDSLALALSQEAITQGIEQSLCPVQRSFLYMPFMHSESLEIHDIAVELFERNGIESTLEFELQHRQIIERFGRYPHRNKILRRESTPEEIEFLKQPNSSF
ncbi:DUF924 family protein [Echinimonas agarilytica]|uniref:DUF924 domain-containing protein n=1 Tax=Echinimonas agarilytica TaxID=1215918 RepID=A0AA41W5W7_9GAMM|nr:DUF924 family protein [Echinimonas agarilytica]MCM2679154.1 DUF924 domain-containing protein [Echinimonas agarilytica]